MGGWMDGWVDELMVGYKQWLIGVAKNSISKPRQHLQPAASERKPPLPDVLLCKSVFFYVGGSRTEAGNGPFVYTRIPVEVTCSNVE
jgi:hypothetical protein